MIRYHNQEVPHVAVRSQFLSEIVTPDTAGWAASTSAWERAQVFLGYLANFLLSLGESSYPQFLLARETWYDQEIVTLLLAHTFILARLETKGSVSSRLGFSSDWLFEYFLALYLREESLHATGVEARTANINEKMSNSRRPKGNDPLIGALNYFAEWALVNALEIFALLLRVASIDDPPGLRSAFLETLMESVRAQSGFDKPIQTDSGNTIKSFCALMAEMRECLAPSGFSRILLYIERMGDDTTSDALCLLTLEPKLWEGLDSASFADFISIRALKHFKADRIDLAMNDLRELKLEDISGEVRGRYSFVMGHCLQFKREYAEALRLFSVCRDAPGFYGSMCRHQIAFIQFFQQSDYRGAAEMLSTARSSGKWSNSASKLLFATCLIELGRYSEAADLLNDEAERRRKSRQHLGYGKVIRTLAQLHFRRFDADQAAEKIELAMNATRSAAHYLTYAGALEVKATVVGVLGGNLRNALQLVNDAIEENQRAGYAPGVSWAVQTRSFMHALAGDTGSMEADLAWVSRLGCNPNQERRTEFIRLIGRWCGNASQYETDAETAERLRARYEDAGNAWYPGILSLLIAAIRGTARGDGAGASDYFKEDIDQKGLISSFLFRVISSPRERPAPRVI